MYKRDCWVSKDELNQQQTEELNEVRGCNILHKYSLEVVYSILEGSPGSKKAFTDETPTVKVEQGSRLLISIKVAGTVLMTGARLGMPLSVTLTW